MPPGGGAPGAGGQEPKHEGVAEAAPKTPGLLPTTPTLPPPKSHRKRLQVLELDGYFRVRTNWFKNFNLGFNDDPTKGGAPFIRPLGCQTPANPPPTPVNTPCGSSLSDANMRLRLEPTVNIDETTALHAQIDMLDNQILGGTPEGQYLDGTTPPGNIPIVAFSNNVVMPVAGVTDSKDSINVKRAWAEVGTPLGLVQFGRMPDQWGLGILHNAGGYDPINGTYDYDADHGDQVDRVSFSALVPGTRIKAMVALDWPASGLISTFTNNPVGKITGQAIDLQDEDDVTQYSVVVSQTDTPVEFRDALDRGEHVLDWGGYFQYRTQQWDYSGTFKEGVTPDVTKLVNRNYKAYVFDPWVKFGVGDWLLEGEGAAVIGSVGTVADYCQTFQAASCASGSVALRQLGGVARATYTGSEGKLRVGFETGYASGDQYDSEAIINGKLTTVPGLMNIQYARLIPQAGDGNMTQFIFDPDYKIDLILFRHLIGAVTNALYLRPKLEYDISKNFTLKVWNVTSFAARPVATPGNGSMYGIEFDGDLGYNSPSFFAGVSTGVLFPLAALSHPADNGTGTGFGYDALTNQGDASTAYTFQMRLAVKF
jgi:uncharacterized protein (TIGR04551 family)